MSWTQHGRPETAFARGKCGILRGRGRDHGVGWKKYSSTGAAIFYAEMEQLHRTLSADRIDRAAKKRPADDLVLDTPLKMRTRPTSWCPSLLLMSDERCRRPIAVDESVQGVSDVWPKVRLFVVEWIAYKLWAWTLVCCAKMLRFALMMFLLICTYSLLSCFSWWKNSDQWKLLFFSVLSLDDGMAVTPVRCAAGYSSRDVPEERCFFWLDVLYT